MHFTPPYTMPSSDAPLDNLLTSISEYAQAEAPDSSFLDNNDTISLGLNSDTFSPTPEIFIAPVDPPPQLGNTHSMITRSKDGIFKPKSSSMNGSPALLKKLLLLATQEEYDALIRNHTRTLVPLPPGRKAIGCKWLFKIKRNPDGCLQVPGCDFPETFSLVVKLATIHTILSITVTKQWSLRQVDVNNAFLNDDLIEEVFMLQPFDYVQTDLNKALYGLWQALKAWFNKLKAFLVFIGFVISKFNASLFIRITNEPGMYVLVYDDEIIITGDFFVEIDAFVHQLHIEFSLKDMGSLHSFLGVKVTISSICALYLCQGKYIVDLLDQYHMDKAKGIHKPMSTSCPLSKHVGTLLDDPSEYQSIAEALQYVVLTRPDITYVVNCICQFMHAPTNVHFIAIKHILRYLCTTIDFGLYIQPSKRLSPVRYIDAN
ncbi:Copia protein [Gossypium australe]|uniref:Copia protein n=1 Tax=Gossypium australe TaxID=47621 RepID=A0A5B6V1L9_9ROSI|nr:Copia protein [Gossypium australe]